MISSPCTFHRRHADRLPAGQRQERGRDDGHARKHAGGQKDVGRWESLRQQNPAERPRGDTAQPSDACRKPVAAGAHAGRIETKSGSRDKLDMTLGLPTKFIWQR